MTQAELNEIVRLHGMWLRAEPGGVHADLSGANLSGADLRGANLSGAVRAMKERANEPREPGISADTMFFRTADDDG